VNLYKFSKYFFFLFKTKNAMEKNLMNAFLAIIGMNCKEVASFKNLATPKRRGQKQIIRIQQADNEPFEPGYGEGPELYFGFFPEDSQGRAKILLC